MLKLGLTGSIATGKSTVLQAFADLGVPIFSADEAVHALYAGEAVPVVEALFPGVTHNGTVDRQALSARLLSHPERLVQLEQAIHPLVRARMKRFIDEAEARGETLAVIDVPLLFDTGHDYGFDKIAVTFTDDATLRSRALARPGMSVEKLDAILARQLPQAEKKARADYLFDTTGSIEATRKAVADLVATLRSDRP